MKHRTPHRVPRTPGGATPHRMWRCGQIAWLIGTGLILASFFPATVPVRVAVGLTGMVLVFIGGAAKESATEVAVRHGWHQPWPPEAS